jgi:HEAT repeat protein
LALALSAHAQSSAPALTPAQDLELKTLAGQIADPERAYKTKIEAAELLLSREYPQATDALRDLLSDPSNRSGQIAIAEALARRQESRAAFETPLIAMLTGTDPAVRAPAARALVLYRGAGVTEKLVAVACDAKWERQVRLVAVGSLRNVLTRRSIDALVELLDDPDASIRDAAAEALAEMTGLKPSAADAQPWKAWWQVNRGREQAMWLADLAASLARSKSAIETEAQALRERLSRSLTELYEATPPAQRDAVLAGLLRDAISDVRLTALALVGKRAQAAEPVSADLRAQVRSLWSDSEPRVRLGAVQLTVTLGDAQVQPYIDALKTEDSVLVRAGLIAGLGHLRDAKGLDAVVAELRDSRYDAVAAAAANALARIAGKQALDHTRQAQVLGVLVERYKQAARHSDGLPLREGLLTAIGAVGQKESLAILREALNDSGATVRQAAADALARIGSPDAADLLVPLLADQDRGVRQSAIAAMAAIGEYKHVEAVLHRTEPAVETDAAVCQQARDAVVAILAKVSDDRLAAAIAALAARPRTDDLRARLLESRAAALKSRKSDQLAAVQRELAAELLKTSRVADAAASLGEAYAALQAAGAAEATAVWNEWIDAMLAGDDPAAARAIAAQKDQDQFASAYKRLGKRVDVLVAGEKLPAVIAICGEAQAQLGERIDPADRDWLLQTLQTALAKQSAADRQRVSRLCAQLSAADDAARKSAAGELAAMGERVVEPLVGELRRCITSEKPAGEAEKAILAVLRQVAPKLNGYDVDAALEERLRCIDGWLAPK